VAVPQIGGREGQMVVEASKPPAWDMSRGLRALNEEDG